MNAHPGLRDLYLPAGAKPHLPAGKAVAAILCRTASISQLRVLLDHDWISHPALYAYEVPDEQIGAHLASLRGLAEQALHRLLDRFAASLHDEDVARFPFDRGADTGHTIDAYVTGGVAGYEPPSDIFEAWDIVYATDKFPPSWCGKFGAALGLLHPAGTGPTAITVSLHRWAPARSASRHATP